ncbi:hypothetical protein, partial [Acinetobacter baumannii]|uniref:hypothetical protein n=1 Tax=Acinetobacter baumannii TaxID=470 RepID=UPI001BB46694
CGLSSASRSHTWSWSFMLLSRLKPHFLAGQADRVRDCNAAITKTRTEIIKPEKAESVAKT